MSSEESKQLKKDEDTRTSVEASTDRRKALRRLLVGSGVVAGSKVIPEKWSRPVIDSVLLPAHAVSSPNSPFFPDTSGP